MIFKYLTAEYCVNTFFYAFKYNIGFFVNGLNQILIENCTDI